MRHLYCIWCGYILDAMLGDPSYAWHPVCLIGKLVAKMEVVFRSMFPKTAKAELWGGVFLWLTVSGISVLFAYTALTIATLIHPVLGVGIEILLCYQLIARKCLKTEAQNVQSALTRGIEDGRIAVARIVGRDTNTLDEKAIMRATVETVAENTTDGVTAPILFLALGGVPLGILYKAVNTMDSMVGYKNDKYLYLGRFAAKMDDLLNWLPARMTAWLMILSAALVGADSKNAFRIWLRDRRKHSSPNSAQTEAACAGALHIQLAGDAWYFGKLVQKSTIGDPDRDITPLDIQKSCRLMDISSIFFLIIVSTLYFIF